MKHGQAIDQALRSHCGISGKQYFVAVIREDGTPTTFFSPGQKLNDNVVHQFFNPRRFQEVTSHLDTGPNQSFGDFQHGLDANPYRRANYGNRFLDTERRRAGDDLDDDTGSAIPRSAGRKRHRPGSLIDDDDVPNPPKMRRAIRVQDSPALWSFYDQRFKSCQQSACKLIAKAWVKAVEPKKQSTHPYTGSDEKAPDWWPKPWGTTKEDKVRHKEPDHLYKRGGFSPHLHVRWYPRCADTAAERVHLLNHILSLVVEPNERQHRDIQKLQLNVKKLEECTNEALSGFYAESTTNAGKKQFLNEIFKVAKQQERYKNGEIDGAVEVYVLDNDSRVDEQASENDGNSLSRGDEDDQNASPSTRAAAAAPAQQSFLQTPAATGQSPVPSSHNGSFLNDLPMRAAQQPLLHDMSGAPSHHGFAEGGMAVNGAAGMGGVEMGVPSPQDASRRPSVYSDYNSNSMYTTHHWPSATTMAPDTQAMYAAQAAMPPQTQPFVQQQQAVSVAQHPQSYVGHTFVDHLPRQGYDPTSAHGQMFRTGEVPAGGAAAAASAGQNAGGYSYLSSDGRGVAALPGVSEVIESVPRGV
ncbi:Protein of unknown function (DUF2841) [Geosmithia morbida]|uniref:Subtelomeric hrmA-associated cluster protein AFUB-079030/YDR124W-like helical bundle domain-containing protein n=1 Tax=Geosmithia morbida TaxID=1094350 RepID=A0A9P4YU80_9HYPO|nr:Protein of unknown function (DUF2841) [Geosmithia morbida]KAF4123186.1 Protein of unknown function (DUF2841) [Geosmithia morbida]